MANQLGKTGIFVLAAALPLMGSVFCPELNRVTRAHAVVRAAGRWGYSHSGTIVGFGPVASVGSFA